jgi:hypothetical protein
MRVRLRSRAILLLSIGALLTLRPPVTSANLTLNSGDPNDGSLSVESKSAGEFIVTSSAALSHAALTGLITDSFGPSGAGAADQASTSDCPASNTQVSFDSCFSVPSLNPAGYVFLPQISASNGELYWRFVARPVLAADTGLPRRD